MSRPPAELQPSAVRRRPSTPHREGRADRGPATGGAHRAAPRGGAFPRPGGGRRGTGATPPGARPPTRRRAPHAGPAPVPAHAPRRQRIEPYPVYWGEMRIPGSVSALLELRLGEAGVDALGVAAHVPHYLAQTTYPAASL